MRIAVIGAGIIGITTAYELAADGHEVTVIERRSAAAEESSFANAGIGAASALAPSAAPGRPTQLMANFFRRHSSTKLSLPLLGDDLAWMRQWLRACKPETHQANCARLQRLAFYSRERLHLLTAQRQLDYERSEGCLMLLRSKKEARQWQAGLQSLHDAGVAFEQLDADQTRAIEPSLSAITELLGAIHLPGEEAGNCRQFALLLKTEAQNLGVNFVFNTEVSHIDHAQPATLLIANSDEAYAFDRIVVCAGLASVGLLKPLGLKIPMVAIHGYSLTAIVRDPLNGPQGALRDERYQVSISRLGNRIRVSGCAEIGGTLDSRSESSIHLLYKVLQDWFPGAAQLSPAQGSVQIWKGARPMLPDGPPLIGDSGLPGLWLNVGHGASGWALSCGSARALADLMAGRPTEIDMEGLGLERLR